MVQRTLSIPAANFGIFGKYPCHSMIRTSAGRAVDGMTTFRPRAGIIHLIDDVISLLSLTPR
jgi:hypothetical protein